jgi:7,8-dihydropterin-6-yl-methyl-4-(beta-D-ribofuranosyl)aminobenzene 5'-phosphate synthase
MRIYCLVDNYAPLTSQNILSEHGASFLIESDDVLILFDTGQTGKVLKNNASVMGLDLRKLTHVVLSHGHYDHTGGLSEVLEFQPVVIASQHAFKPKYSKKRYIGSPISLEEVERRTEVVLSENELKIADGIFVTGEIPRITRFETIEGLFLDEERKIKDPLKDDRAMIVGDSLLTGCCHSGIVNTLNYVEENHEIERIIGGLHLHNASEERLSKTMEYLLEKNFELFVGHCTGINTFCRFISSDLSVKLLHSGFILEL